MNSETKRHHLEDYIKLVQEWKLSGMTQSEFARTKGLTRDMVKYRVRKVQKYAPEMLTESALTGVEFAPVPQEFVKAPKPMHEELPMTDQPVLMIQSDRACLQATNQIEPYLLKTALEVMLTC